MEAASVYRPRPTLEHGTPVRSADTPWCVARTPLVRSADTPVHSADAFGA